MQKEFHSLERVKEIVDIVTPENIDCFIADFKMFLQIQMQIRKFDLSKFEGFEGFSIDELENGKVFRWCDDGKPGLSQVNIKFSF